MSARAQLPRTSVSSVVLVCRRRRAGIAVITVSCVRAWSLARASSLFGAAWVFAKATAALSAFRARVGARRRTRSSRTTRRASRRAREAPRTAENPARGATTSRSSPPPSRRRRASAAARADAAARRAEAFVAERTRAVANGGTPGTPALGARHAPREHAGGTRGSGDRKRRRRRDRLGFDAGENPARLPASTRRLASPPTRTRALVAAGPSRSARTPRRRSRRHPGGAGASPRSATARAGGVRRAGVASAAEWSGGSACVHPHKTYETAALMGALNWGGHQLVVACQARRRPCAAGVFPNVGAERRRRNHAGGETASSSSSILPRLRRRRTSETRSVRVPPHLFGSGREITLRNEGGGNAGHDVSHRGSFRAASIVAWHKPGAPHRGRRQRSPRPEAARWERAGARARAPPLRTGPRAGRGRRRSRSPACEFAFCARGRERSGSTTSGETNVGAHEDVAEACRSGCRTPRRRCEDDRTIRFDDD